MLCHGPVLLLFWTLSSSHSIFFVPLIVIIRMGGRGPPVGPWGPAATGPKSTLSEPSEGFKNPEFHLLRGGGPSKFSMFFFLGAGFSFERFPVLFQEAEFLFPSLTGPMPVGPPSDSSIFFPFVFFLRTLAVFSLGVPPR